MEKLPQNNEFILPGDLGTVRIASSGKVYDVVKTVSNFKEGMFTLTMIPINKLIENPTTEDIDHEVVTNKQIDNGTQD